LAGEIGGGEFGVADAGDDVIAGARRVAPQ
jgi:hypothetical protein